MLTLCVLALATAVAYFVGRRFPTWRLALGLLAVGTAAISIDISTRNLAGAGHDDKWLVASTEAIILLLVVCGACVGIARARS